METTEHSQSLNKAPKDKDESQPANETNKSLFSNYMNYINSFDKINVISAFVSCVAILTMLIIGIDECKRCFEEQRYITEPMPKTRKVFRTYGRSNDFRHLRHVFQVLERLGYENDTNESDWDLLWAHDYPFRVLYKELYDLEAYQKVNHFPGCGYLTNKVDLATSGLKYIPKAFKLPEEQENFLKFVEVNPQRKFVLKNNEHRHVSVRNVADINLSTNGSFVQEFIDNPLLVSGHMFDIGVYTIITSIDPLRVYIYNGDYLLRFCPDAYHPFDADNLNKYVVGDDYLPTWEVPGLGYYYNELGFGMRDSLTAYLQSHGQNPDIIWNQIDEAIRTVILSKEPSILGVVNKFKSKRNFFEMMRFDFMVDEDLNVFLLEANMSPNLSSAHFKPNQLLYEQVIYNLFGLVGVAERVDKDSLAIRSENEELMQTAFKNLAVMSQVCNSMICRNDCSNPQCLLCKPCLSFDMELDLVQAHREHLNRGDCKRIFPPKMERKQDLPEDYKNYSLKNQLMYKWFHEKCLLDATWC